MQDGTINLRGKNGKYDGSVRVHLAFDVPDELMKMLINDIADAVNKWQDRIILHDEFQQHQDTDKAKRKGKIPRTKKTE